MEEEMGVEEEMAVEDNMAEEEGVEYSFTAYEIDLDYEFDAARFFDFGLGESPLETRQAELWFDSARSYPPSPFVLKLVQKEDILKENIHISPKAKGMNDMELVQGDSDIDLDDESLAPSMSDRDDAQDMGTSTTRQQGGKIMLKNPSERSNPGLTLPSQMENRPDSKTQTKFSMKPCFPRPSTLMMPTASYLAKQNHPIRAGHSRSIFEKSSSSSMNGVENQAAKRQKLEGGLLRKVEGASQLQQNNFVHKAPKRDGLVDGGTLHTKPRVTIPREPELETAHRAQRIRSKGTKETEKVTSTAGRFKALPLNRKVLKAPSLILKRSTPCLPNFQEFHLKTSERAMQHSSAVSNSRVPYDHFDTVLHKYASNLTSEYGNGESSRTSTINSKRPDGSESSNCFKALALNKKILESKGDIGVFRNNKKETTVPMEFNFHTGKKSHQNPPIELFSQLSLGSGAQQIANLESKLLQPIGLSLKGSKENRWDCPRQGNEIKQSRMSKPSLLGGKQHFNVDEGAYGVDIAAGINWSKDIR